MRSDDYKARGETLHSIFHLLRCHDYFCCRPCSCCLVLVLCRWIFDRPHQHAVQERRTIPGPKPPIAHRAVCRMYRTGLLPRQYRFSFSTAMGIKEWPRKNKTLRAPGYQMSSSFVGGLLCCLSI